MPASIPKVEEVGATSAPLTSAAYFIGDRCQAFNDDYMKCKSEANGRGELECLKEGRKVTRCAASVYVYTLSEVIEDLESADNVQYQGYQHQLLEAVHCPLGVSGEQQPQPVGMPQARDAIEQLRF